eukprot:gnl/Spiro4/80_TR50_c0_g1_i1.p2 gnl/Spiro4/80_TR50_c0_g1~~gnl/Spiro4/80_TR50_c0_g1_i1.p2  ORF type:complete len:156 (-),score=49.39 gnl/Spiro4/80_TR50_c0_g1_i1:58-489(-)
MDSQPAAAAPHAAAPELAASEPMSFMDALKEVIKKSLIYDGLARGLRECVKALDRRQAHLCVLANSCNEAQYIRLIGALCAEHGIHIVKVPDAKKLGEWAGLCKLDREGRARKTVSCGCVVIKDFGEQSAALDIVQQALKSVA